MTQTRFDTCLPVLRERDLLPPTVLATLVVGSAALGRTHSLSDLDLVVVSAEPMVDDRLLVQSVSVIPDVVPVTAFTQGGQRWEIRFWLDSQIDQLIDRVSWNAFENDRKSDGRITFAEELFLDRLRTCVPLTGNDWIRRRREQIDGSALRACVITYQLDKSDSAATAAMGLLEAEETEGAVLAVRDAFTSAVNALLASEGYYATLTKWRARCFHDAAPASLPFADYWAVETMRDYDPTNPGAWVRRVFDMCKEITSDIEI